MLPKKVVCVGMYKSVEEWHYARETWQYYKAESDMALLVVAFHMNSNEISRNNKTCGIVYSLYTMACNIA